MFVLALPSKFDHRGIFLESDWQHESFDLQKFCDLVKKGKPNLRFLEFDLALDEEV